MRQQRVTICDSSVQQTDKENVLYLFLVNKVSNKIATARDLGKEEGLAEGFARGVDMKNKKSLALNRKKI